MIILRAFLIALVLSVIVAADAGACSCVPPEQVFKDAEVAYVGKVIESTKVDDFGARLVVEVERVYKGRASGRLNYRTNTQSASCGFQAKAGDRLGIMQSRGATELFSCSVISPSALRRLAAPLPAPRGEGETAFVVPGPFGKDGLAALDARGRVLRYGRSAAYAVAACPGGERFLAASGRDVAVHRVRDLRVMRRLRARGTVRCLDRKGTRFVAFDDRRLEIVDGSRRRTVRIAEAQGEAALGDRRAVVAAGPYERASIVAIDYATGERRTVHEADGYVYGLALSPDERRVLIAISEMGGGSRLVSVDLDGGAPPRVLESSRALDSLRVAWPSDGEILLSEGGRLQVLDSATLTATATVEGWPFEIAVRAGDAFAVTPQGRVVRADRAAGRVVKLALLPRTNVGALTAIPPRPAAGAARAVLACSWSAMPTPFTAA